MSLWFTINFWLTPHCVDVVYEFPLPTYYYLPFILHYLNSSNYMVLFFSSFLIGNITIIQPIFETYTKKREVQSLIFNFLYKYSCIINLCFWSHTHFFTTVKAVNSNLSTGWVTWQRNRFWVPTNHRERLD